MVVLPIYLVSKAVNPIRMCGAKGILVIPKWKSTVYWPMMVNRFTDDHQSNIKDVREYKRSEIVLHTMFR